MIMNLQTLPGSVQKVASRSVARSAILPGSVPRRSLALRATGNKWDSGLGKDANDQANEAANDISQKLQNTFEDLQVQWERNDEKPTTIALIVAAFVTVWAAGGLIDAVDRLPVIGGVFELVGLGVTGWFVYRYLGTGEDRKELRREFDSFLHKVGVKKD